MKRSTRKDRASDGETDPEADLELLLSARDVAIDSCTIILLGKAMVLDAVASAFRLASVAAVREETGYPGRAVAFSPFDAPLGADSAILSFAKSKGMTLASDDRKLLVRASLDGLVCADSLDLVIAAFGDGKLSDEEATAAIRSLKALRPYPAHRLAEAERLEAVARKYR